MIYRLRMIFEALKSASPLDLGFSPDSKLGSIKLVIDHLSSEDCFEILNLNWNVAEPLEWFRKNGYQILNEPLPPFIGWKGSIYKSILEFWEREDTTDFEDDCTYQYRTRHHMCFGFRGVQIPAIYLGTGPNGWEVSGVRDGTPYVYQVDLPMFLESLNTLPYNLKVK
ncbi:hypothetical protein [Cupriavidus agavae]|uniref:hypothetical protein n=1 Tax=Cupriavidus agavae TaxID=1001822 RepID=UPI00102B31C6|nr:hypothetical protein [Cupriavidus agavae]